MKNELNYKTMRKVAADFNRSRRNSIASKCLDKACNTFSDMGDLSREDEGMGLLPKFYLQAAAYGVSKFVEDRIKLAKIQMLLQANREEIALDINEYEKSKCTQKVYADNFRYSGDINVDGLKNLEYIWGDADFKALTSEQLENLKSLKAVLGNLYLPSGSLENVYVGGETIVSENNKVKGLTR